MIIKKLQWWKSRNTILFLGLDNTYTAIVKKNIV